MLPFGNGLLGGAGPYASRIAAQAYSGSTTVTSAVLSTLGAQAGDLCVMTNPASFSGTPTIAGNAIGPGELEIKGNHWTYMGKSEEGGKTTWYRTTNDFSDENHIHFEQSQSTDKTTWEVQRTGDEIRTDKDTK